MLISPVDMLAWYRRWPSWAKVVGFVFFAVFFIGGTIIWFMLKDRTDGDSKVYVDAYNEDIEEQIDENTDMVASIEKERDEIHAEDSVLVDEIASDEEDRRALHSEVGNASSAAELDDLYERLRAGAKRRNQTK